MTFQQLLTGLTVTFAAPWLTLIVLPYRPLAELRPVAYDEDKGDELKGFFPPARTSSEARGAQLFIDEGCVQCHTQVIRPQYVGGDGDEYKMGWGEEQKSAAPTRVRNTTPWDYLGEPFAAIGQRRIGSDLANAGYRFKDRKEVLAHLYDPQAKYAWSSCPAQHQLFDTKKIGGQESNLAVKITPEGEQVVAGSDAVALADYILSLKKNYPLPAPLRPAKSKDAAPATPAAAAPAPAAPAAKPAAAPAGAPAK